MVCIYDIVIPQAAHYYAYIWRSGSFCADDNNNNNRHTNRSLYPLRMHVGYETEHTEGSVKYNKSQAFSLTQTLTSTD